MTYWVHKWTALSERGRFLIFVTKDLDLINKQVGDYHQNSNGNCGFTMMFIGLLLISTACFVSQDSKMVQHYFVAQTVPELQAFLWQSSDGFWYLGKVKKFQINRYIRLGAIAIYARGGLWKPTPPLSQLFFQIKIYWLNPTSEGGGAFKAPP